MPEPVTSRQGGVSTEPWDPKAVNQSLPPPNKCEEPAKAGPAPASDGQLPRGAKVLVAKVLARRSEAALLSGPASGGGRYEVLATTRERGVQDEESVALYRERAQLGTGEYFSKVSVTSEVGSAKISLGGRTPDGEGLNFAVQANALQTEATWRMGASDENSITFGLSVGPGAEFSLTERDRDHDGKPEKCVRLGIGPLTLGRCLEDDPVLASSDGDRGTGGAPGR